MPTLTLDDLRRAHDFDTSHALVVASLERVVAVEDLLRWMHRYTWWNGYFGSGVAGLAAKVGRSRGIFMDPEQPLPVLADRSVLIGSHIFDAARDEFDDRDTEHRDTHRCLAQATVAGLLNLSKYDPIRDRHHLVTEYTDRPGVFDVPMWLEALCERVAQGYGEGSPDTDLMIFFAMGFHLGSEILADQEFTLIDGVFRERFPEAREALMGMEIDIGGQAHNAYQWIRVHGSGEDGGHAEAEHFEAAMEAARLALRYTPQSRRDGLRHQMILGFQEFAAHHREFFEHI